MANISSINGNPIVINSDGIDSNIVNVVIPANAGQTEFRNNQFVAGEKYIIYNFTNYYVNMSTRNTTGGSNIDAFGSIAAYTYKIVDITANASIFRAWFDPAVTGGCVVATKVTSLLGLMLSNDISVDEYMPIVRRASLDGYAAHIDVDGSGKKVKFLISANAGDVITTKIYNIGNTISGGASGAYQLVDTDGNVAENYYGHFSLTEDDTPISTNAVTLPYDVTAILLSCGNALSGATITRLSYDIAFSVNESDNSANGVRPFVRYDAEQNLPESYKLTARSNIDAQSASAMESSVIKTERIVPAADSAEWWNTYIDVDIPAGAAIRFKSWGYSGDDFVYNRISVRNADTQEEVVVTTVYSDLDQTFSESFPIDRIWLQIRRNTITKDVFAYYSLTTMNDGTLSGDLLGLKDSIDRMTVGPTFTCLKSGGNFSSLFNAINAVCEYQNATLYVGAGTWDLIDEMGEDYLNAIDEQHRGLYLKNNVHVICSSDALITCHYTGTRELTRTWLSAFNAGEHGFTLENARIESSNCRYTIHDERDTHTDRYVNRYINCRMKHDNTNGGYSQVIGGGLGYDGHIIIEGCVFEQPHVSNEGIVSYHNTWYAGGDGRSLIDVHGCYFKGTNTIRFSWFGASQDISTLLAHDNSLGRAIINVAESEQYMIDNPTWINNTEVIAWNNEIRS